MPKGLAEAAWSAQGEHGLDLRRKHNAGIARKIAQRAHWLDREDRELALAYFDRGMSAASIGALIGQNPRFVRKRLKHIVNRLADPRSAYVVANRNAWTASRRAVAEELFLHGHSKRDVSQRLGLSLHNVRKHRDAIEAMSQAQHNEGRASRTWQRSEQFY